MLVVGVVLAIVLIVGLLGLWWSVKRQPAWYVEQAQASVESPESREAGREMEQGIARIISGFEKSGQWEVVFTEQQVNAYLATMLPQKHPELLPPELHDPRVKIEADGLTLAARIETPIETVVSLKVDVYLAKPNTIAVRIRKIRAGSLPWPVDRLMSALSDAAEQNGVPLTWTRSDQDPIAMITVVSPDPKKSTQITACQLEDGKLYLAGVTKRVP